MSDGAFYDVVVAGAGPGGGMAAKACAEAGLKTVLLEMRGLPRDKVCTGMIMAPWCGALLTSEFGPVPFRRFYDGALDMDRKVIHWLFPRSRPRPRFDLVHKGEGFLLEGSGVRDLDEEIPAILAEYGFRGDRRPAWRDGCLVARLHGPLIDGVFRPAAGRVLLVGDAAGLILPVTFEGIGTALESGRLAAETIQKAVCGGGEAAEGYLAELAPLLAMIRRLCRLEARLEQTAETKTGGLAEALASAYGEAMEDPRPASGPGRGGLHERWDAPGARRTGSSRAAPKRSQ